MKPIANIETPFSEKFGVPRQSGLVSEAWGVMRFPRDDFYMEAFRGIEDCTHLWLIFEFHQVHESEVKALVRPPRFFGKKKLGVFATRSPHRPNRLGLSVVTFDRLEFKPNEIELWVKGVDLVSGTPIFDIKPYIPYSDLVKEARALHFEAAPEIYPVTWLCESPEAKDLIEKIIALDPRPGQDQSSSEEYGVSIAGYNVRFRMKQGTFEILSCKLIV